MPRQFVLAALLVGLPPCLAVANTRPAVDASDARDEAYAAWVPRAREAAAALKTPRGPACALATLARCQADYADASGTRTTAAMALKAGLGTSAAGGEDTSGDLGREALCAAYALIGDWEAARAIAKGIGHAGIRANAWAEIAIQCVRIEKLAEAKEAVAEAVRAAREQSRLKAFSPNFERIATVHVLCGDEAGAAAALGLAPKARPSATVTAHASAARTLAEWGRIGQAREVLALARKHLADVTKPDQQALGLAHIAEAEAAWGDAAAAARTLRAGMAAVVKATNASEPVMVGFFLLRATVALGDKKTLDEYVDILLKITAKAPDEDRAFLLRWIVWAYAALGDLATAQRHADRIPPWSTDRVLAQSDIIAHGARAGELDQVRKGIAGLRRQEDRNLAWLFVARELAPLGRKTQLLALYADLTDPEARWSFAQGVLEGLAKAKRKTLGSREKPMIR